MKENKRVRIGNFIGPLLLYYLATWIAQIIFAIWALPKAMLNFIEGNLEIKEMMPSGFEQLKTLDLTYEFLNVVDEDIYFDFIYDLTYMSLEYLAEITIIASLVGIPMFYLLMKRDRKKERIILFDHSEKWKTPYYGLIVVGAVALCIALNSIITLSNLAELSEAYQDTSESLYSIGFMQQIIGLGIIVPVCEELLYRGVLYQRLKAHIKVVPAMFISAFIFGTMHGNIVQILYAGLLGVVFAWLYEHYKSIWAPILAHIIMNITSVVLSEYGIFELMFKEPLVVGIVTVFTATLSATIYVLIQNNILKNTNEKS